MGFTADVALTENDDVLKYAFEQQLTNLLRGSNTYTELHKGAVNDLIRRLRAKGYTTAQIAGITNTEDWKPCLVYWFLSRVFRGQAGANPGQREAALSKAREYDQLFEKYLDDTAVVTSDARVRQNRGLPVGVNIDAASSFPALGTARPTNIAGGEITGFDELMLEGR